MSTFRRAAAGAAFVLASLWWVGSSTPAQACSQPVNQPTEDERMQTAPIVIVGRANAVSTRTAPTTSSVDDPPPTQYVYSFDVEYIHKGEDLVDDPATVVTGADSSTCGFQLELGKLYKLFPTRSGDGHELTIAQFDGSRPASDADLRPYVPGTTTTATTATTLAPRSGLTIPVQTIPRPKDVDTTTTPSTDAAAVAPPTFGDAPSTTPATIDDEEAAVVVEDGPVGGDHGTSWFGPVAVALATAGGISLAGVLAYRRRAAPGGP